MSVSVYIIFLFCAFIIMANSINIFSLNCQGFGPKSNKILNLFYELSVDVLFLQETFRIPENIQEKFRNDHPDLVLNFKHAGHPTQGGIGTLSRRSINLKEITGLGLQFERFSKFEISKGDFEIEVINIYAPAEQGRANANFYKNINNFLISDRKLPIILIGDFNFVEEPAADRSRTSAGYLERSEISRETFRQISSARKLVDVYRNLYPYGVGYTHFNKGCGIHSRLDRIYIHGDFLHKVSKFHSSSAPISDHFPIGITIENKISPKWGFGHKKMNPYYFSIPAFRTGMDDNLLNYELEKCRTDPIGHWETFKNKAWKSYNNVVKSFHHNNKVYLEQLYNAELQSEEITDEIFNILDIPNQLKKATATEFYKEAAEEDFLPLFNKNKTKYDKKKNIHMIINSLGQKTTNKEEIIEEIRKFYAKLYTSENPSDHDIGSFLNMDLPQVKEPFLAPMANFISVAEVRKAIMDSNKSKTPGPDGIPIEFYQTFIDEVTHHLAEVYNNIFLRGEAHKDFNNSITTLIYKEKGERCDIKNWRPVSLLNTDYKILTKILANRITPALPDLINKNQTCGVPGRSSFENLYNLESIFDQCQNSNKRCLIVNIDQEKAFDRIEYKYIKAVLDKFGFPPEIIKWYGIINNDAMARICVNGLLSENIEITRSVRQGDPLSMIIYILGIEPLASNINTDKNIHGFWPINSTESKFSQYADDSNPILADVRSFTHVKHHFKKFGLASGSKINEGKTKILALGKWANFELDPIRENLKESIDILGVTFGKDLIEINWPKILAKCYGVIKSWKSTHLAIRSKIYICNTFVLSNIWHVARIIPIKTDQIQELQSAICRFIWGGPFESVCRDTAYLHPLEGGLGIPNIRAKIEALYLQRLAYAKIKLEDRPPWVGHLIYHQGFSLRVIGPGFALNCFKRSVLTTVTGSSILSPRSAAPLERLRRTPGYEPEIWSQKKTRPFYNILTGNHTPKIMQELPGLPWSRIWSHVWKIEGYSRHERQFMFLQIHGVLPTVHRHGPSIPSIDPNDGLCPFCNLYLETNKHIFERCALLERFRVQVLRFVRTRATLDGIFREDQFLKFISLDMTDANDRQFKTVYTYQFAYKYSIWKMRCAINMGAPVPNYQQLVDKFNSYVRPITYKE